MAWELNNHNKSEIQAINDREAAELWEEIEYRNIMDRRRSNQDKEKYIFPVRMTRGKNETFQIRNREFFASEISSIVYDHPNRKITVTFNNKDIYSIPYITKDDKISVTPDRDRPRYYMHIIRSDGYLYSVNVETDKYDILIDPSFGYTTTKNV